MYVLSENDKVLGLYTTRGNMLLALNIHIRRGGMGSYTFRVLDPNTVVDTNALQYQPVPVDQEGYVEQKWYGVK